MTTRRSFFSALAALVVAPKVLKPPVSATAFLAESPLYGFSSMAAMADHQRHMDLHYADLISRGDWVEFYALDDHPHLTKANQLAWRRHVRLHELAMEKAR